MVHQLRHLLVRHRVDLVEALDDVAVARLLVREIHRRMAVHARAGLLDDHLALREPLVLEHVVVAALLAEIFRERVALPHRLEAGVLFDLRARHDRARVGLGRCLRHGLAAAVLGALHVDRFLVELVVLRKRLAPFGRIVDVVAEGRAAQLSLAGGVRCCGLRCAGGRNEQEDRRERSHAGARKRSRVAQPAGRCGVSERLGRNLSLCHGPSRSPKTREYRAGRHRRLLHLRALLNAARADAEGPFGALSSTPRSNMQSVGPRPAAYWPKRWSLHEQSHLGHWHWREMSAVGQREARPMQACKLPSGGAGPSVAAQWGEMVDRARRPSGAGL